MEFKSLIKEEDAVSPVIGVILMVAITVILAAVIGTFVLGLGGQVQETAPNAQFTWDDQGGLEVTHQSGPNVEAPRLEVTNTDHSLSGTHDCNEGGDWSGGTTVSSGSSCTVETSVGNIAGTYRLTWESQDGEQSSTLSTYEA